MSANQYLVSATAPITVHNSDYPYATMVFNSSTVDTLYLSENPNNNGFPLSPGSSISWDAGKALYLYVNSGVSLFATVVDNGGNLTDAGAIAAQIQISGAPPVDNPKILFNGDASQLGGGGTLYNISAYQTLNFSYSGTLSSNAVTDLVSVYITQFSDATLETVWSTTYIVLGKGKVEGSIPLRGSILVIQCYLNGVQISVPDQGHVSLTASYRNIKQSAMLYPGTIIGSSPNCVVDDLGMNTGSDNYTGWTWSVVNANETRTDYPSFKPGPCQVVFILNLPVTAGTVICSVTDAETGRKIATTQFSTGVIGTNLSFIAPNRAIGIQYTTSVGFTPTNNFVFVAISSSD